MRDDHTEEQNGDDETHRITIEFQRAVPDHLFTGVIAIFNHLARVYHADQQAGQEYEALRVLDKGELAMVDFHQPEAAGKHQMVDQHEDEEVTTHPVDQVKAFHFDSSPFSRAVHCPATQPGLRDAGNWIVNAFLRLRFRSQSGLEPARKVTLTCTPCG